MEPEKPKCECLTKPKNIILIVKILMDVAVLIYMIVLIIRMSAKFLMDIWMGWSVFTYILVAVWGIAVIIHYLGKTPLFDPTGKIYVILSIGSLIVVMGVYLGYSIPLRGKSLDLLIDIGDNYLKYIDDAPDDFTDRKALATWVDDRAYYAGQNTLIIFTVWEVFSAFYVFHLLCFSEPKDAYHSAV